MRAFTYENTDDPRYQAMLQKKKDYRQFVADEEVKTREYQERKAEIQHQANMKRINELIAQGFTPAEAVDRVSENPEPVDMRPEGGKLEVLNNTPEGEARRRKQEADLAKMSAGELSGTGRSEQYVSATVGGKTNRINIEPFGNKEQQLAELEKEPEKQPFSYTLRDIQGIEERRMAKNAISEEDKKRIDAEIAAKAENEDDPETLAIKKRIESLARYSERMPRNPAAQRQYYTNIKNRNAEINRLENLLQKKEAFAYQQKKDNRAMDFAKLKQSFMEELARERLAMQQENARRLQAKDEELLKRKDAESAIKKELAETKAAAAKEKSDTAMSEKKLEDWVKAFADYKTPAAAAMELEDHGIDTDRLEKGQLEKIQGAVLARVVKGDRRSPDDIVESVISDMGIPTVYSTMNEYRKAKVSDPQDKGWGFFRDGAQKNYRDANGQKIYDRQKKLDSAIGAGLAKLGDVAGREFMDDAYSPRNARYIEKAVAKGESPEDAMVDIMISGEYAKILKALPEEIKEIVKSKVLRDPELVEASKRAILTGGKKEFLRVFREWFEKNIRPETASL